MKSQTLIALMAAPGSVEGLRAHTTPDSPWRVDARASRPWPEGGTAEELKRAAAEVVRELTSAAMKSVTGVAALHPALTSCVAADVPPADAKTVGDFLAVWAGRHWPEGRYGNLRTAWRLLPDRASKHQALVYAARTNIVEALTGAFAEARVPLLAMVPATEVWERVASGTVHGRDAVLLHVESGGAILAEIEGGKLTDVAWLASDDADGLRGRFATAALAVNDARVRRPNAALLVSGRDAGKAREAEPSLSGTEANGWHDSWTKSVQFMESAATAETDPGLGGLVAHSRELADNAPRFAGKPRTWERWEQFVAHPRLGKWAAMLAIAFVLAVFIAWKFEGIMTARAAAAADRIGVDLPAVEEDIRLLNELDARRDYLKLFADLGAVKPDGTLITGLEVDAKGNFSLDGTTQNFTAVEQLVVKLNASPAFSDATTQSTTRENNQIKFSIRGKLGRKS